MKRGLDILLSLLALIVLSPLFLFIGVVLRFTGEGHVFYRQQRVGKGGRMFGLLKFATMLKDSPSLPGGLLTSKHDPRVLPVGRVLRATKINELPQFVNVLVGDMSLIGPRPQAKPHFDVFPGHVRKEIVKVRPGLSGIGSIFFRDEDAVLAESGQDEALFYAEDIAPYKGELEVWYVKNRSLKLDLVLMLMTAWVVVAAKSTLHCKLFADVPRPKSESLARHFAESERATVRLGPIMETMPHTKVV